MSKVVLGIDVSKKKLSIALLENDRFFNKEVSNNFSGFSEILKFLSQKTTEKPKIYMESTGSYSENVADFFSDHGFDVKVVNPLKIHSFSKATLSRNKTDKADARLIAEYGSKFNEISYQKPPENVKELRALYRCSLELKRQMVQCKNHLENRNVMPKSVVEIWEKTLENLKLQIKNLDKQMLNVIKMSKDLLNKFNRLTSIPGIAQTTAIAILAEIQDISRFCSARQLAAYIGVTPKHRNSGTSVHFKPSISKIGNVILRKALYLPAIAAIRCNETFAKFADLLRTRKKFWKQIVIAVMKKMIHAIFEILTKDSFFNEKILFRSY